MVHLNKDTLWQPCQTFEYEIVGTRAMLIVAKKYLSTKVFSSQFLDAVNCAKKLCAPPPF